MPDMSDASATQVWHECYTNDTSATQVKNFDFDNDTSKNIFLHPYIYYMASEDYKLRENFILKTTFWKCLVPTVKCIWKVHHKNQTSKWWKLYQKVIPQIIDANALGRSRIVAQYNAASFSVKAILCENTTILFSKNYWKLGKMNARFWKSN